MTKTKMVFSKLVVAFGRTSLGIYNVKELMYNIEIMKARCL